MTASPLYLSWHNKEESNENSWSVLHGRHTRLFVSGTSGLCRRGSNCHRGGERPVLGGRGQGRWRGPRGIVFGGWTSDAGGERPHPRYRSDSEILARSARFGGCRCRP